MFLVKTKKMRSNINMNVSLNPPSSRVLIGSPGAYNVVVHDQTIQIASGGELRCASEAKLAGSDLLTSIRSERANPVLPGVVSDPNIKDGAVTIAKLDPASTPLPVSRGGTGLSSVAQGDLLVGTSGGSDVRASADVKWDSPNLEVNGELGIGGAKIAISTDAYGRKSLFSYDANGVSTNMIAPSSTPPSVLGVGVSNGSISATRGGGYPVDAFFAWSQTETSLNRESVVSEGRAGVSRSGRVRFRGANAIYSLPALDPGTYNLFAVMRDARGTCSSVATGTYTSPP